MVAEGEQFAEEDARQRKRQEMLNNLSSLVYDVKAHVANRQGLGGKLGPGDRKVLMEIVKEGNAWIDDYGKDASLEDLEEKLAGECSCMRVFCGFSDIVFRYTKQN